MKITYLGHASFLLETAAGTRIVTDPYGQDILPHPVAEADIVTMSHEHYDHCDLTQEMGDFEAVNTAEDHALPDLQHTVNRLHDLGIVTDEARDRLDEQIRNRYATLYARRGGPGLDTGDAEGPEYLLRCALEGQTPLILLVDGHNTLYSLQSRYSRPQDHRGPSSEARDWLVNDLVQIFANARNCRVILVFDGPERSETNPAGNVKVVFSGGGGAEVEHRADDVLVDEARFLREADPDCRLLIATNDNGLSSRAAAFGARNLPPTALVAYFR